jgi:hypothetical protein
MFARMTMAFASLTALLISWGAAGQDQDATLAMPAMARCTNSSHPLLPEKWHGTYLMAPFTRAQLTLGDFVYDGSIPALRVRLYGLRRGSLDLLIKGRTTYLLGEAEASPGDCLELGDTGLRPFPRDWLARDAQCAGSAPIAGLAVDWWKKRSDGASSANWIWYETSGRSPFRLMFTQPTDELAVLGWYTFSYQTRFETLSATDLAAIAGFCQSKRPHPAGTGRMALQRMIAAMERSPYRADASLARLMPELDAACSEASLPRWPEHARMTAFMTSPNFKDSPMPAEVLYDWSRQSQRTRMFLPPQSNLVTKEALLLGGRGYQVERARAGRQSCSATLPGPPRPNWPETGGCSCEAVIKGKTALTPFGPARIMVCPMTEPRVVWSWFAFDGRPMVFMETSAPHDKPSGVLALVDYYAWDPDRVPASAAFEMPAQCPAPKATEAFSPASSQHGMKPGSERCGACHLDNTAHH